MAENCAWVFDPCGGHGSSVWGSGIHGAAVRETSQRQGWRIPPSFDGASCQPLPRFTAFKPSELDEIRDFFSRLASELIRVLVPGGHVFIATNPIVSHLVYEPFIAHGFDKRGEIVRIVKTLRGGDRPKNAHAEFHFFGELRVHNPLQLLVIVRIGWPRVAGEQRPSNPLALSRKARRRKGFPVERPCREPDEEPRDDPGCPRLPPFRVRVLARARSDD